jgi:hypothetical protein
MAIAGLVLHGVAAAMAFDGIIPINIGLGISCNIDIGDK